MRNILDKLAKLMAENVTVRSKIKKEFLEMHPAAQRDEGLNELFDNIWRLFSQVKNNTTITPGSGPDNETDLNQDMEFKIAAICLYSVLSLISIFGNSTFCVFVWRQKKLHSVTNILMTNLAISNLSFIIFNAPMLILRYILQAEWNYGEFLCKFATRGLRICCTILKSPLY